MGLILRHGNILRVNGSIARDGSGRECCCKCCCIQFNNVPEPSTLVATFDAPGCPEVDGNVMTLTLGAPSANECVIYSGSENPFCNGSRDPDHPDVDYGLTLRCTNLYPNGSTRGFCTEFELVATPVSSGCDSSGNVTLIPPDSCTCEPFSLTYSGLSLDDRMGVSGECDCCPGGFSVTITES